jgi:hypothetical protein
MRTTPLLHLLHGAPIYTKPPVQRRICHDIDLIDYTTSAAERKGFFKLFLSCTLCHFSFTKSPPFSGILLLQIKALPNGKKTPRQMFPAGAK